MTPGAAAAVEPGGRPPASCSNQAYGYLFPHRAVLRRRRPARRAAVDRPAASWSALLLVARRTSACCCWPARLRYRQRARAALLAALAYALAPRMLTDDRAAVTAEMLPMVVLPWVLPAAGARVQRVGSARRAAGCCPRCAVLCMGGINAVAVVMAAAAAGALCLVTSGAGACRLVRLAGLVVPVRGRPATLWWTVPLAGRVGQLQPAVPRLHRVLGDHDRGDVVLPGHSAGTNQWVGYIVQGEPWWPAGWVLVDNAVG